MQSFEKLGPSAPLSAAGNDAVRLTYDKQPGDGRLLSLASFGAARRLITAAGRKARSRVAATTAMGLALRLAFLAPFACGNHGGTPWWKEEVADARRCTSRGREVACLDVSTCARRAAKKVAIASVFDAHVPLEATRGAELKS